MADAQGIPPDSARKLRRWNLGVGLIHAAQATLLLLLASDASLPVYAGWIDGPPGAAEPVTGEPLFELPFAAATAAFLYLAAVDHLLVGGPLRGWYERNLARSINYARWIEYALSASLMVVLIAMLAGIWELTALVALFGVNAGMILFGLMMERTQAPGRDADFLPFWFGSILGAVPWLVIGIQLVRAVEQTDVPGFVVAIFVSLLVLFALFAVNLVLQYRQVGPWRDYLFGERAYIVLSLTAKSALAWQVYAGALAG
jgi:bacteriorhodopsin